MFMVPLCSESRLPLFPFKTIQKGLPGNKHLGPNALQSLSLHDPHTPVLEQR